MTENKIEKIPAVCLDCRFKDSDALEDYPCNNCYDENKWREQTPKQKALEEVKRGDYCNTAYFDRFLRKIERHSESDLVKELFGSQDAYIDTQGGFHKSHSKNDSIIEFEEDNGYDVEALFKWYCANFEKAWRWMYPLRHGV